MKASWEIIEKNQGVLNVEVNADQVTEALDKAFKKVSQKVNVPGFRKGKVPRGIFEARFGVESLYQDAIDILLPDAYADAIKETGIEPVDRPEIDVEQFGKGQTFVFKAKVLVKPEVKLGEYKGLEVPVAEAEVTDEELNAELERLQQRHAELVVIDEGAVEKGDITIIDFEGSVDGEPFEGGSSERYSLEIGSGSFIPGFEDQLVGMRIGDFKDVEVTFPENYHAEDLKGKAAVFKVKLHEIKRKNLPALDDEFAKDVSEFDTLEEYKQDLAASLKARKEKDAEQARETAVIEKAAAGAEVDIPAVMIETETDYMIRDFENRLKQQGMNLELYYQFSGQDESALREQMKSDAEKRVLNNLVLEAVAKQEGIVVSEDELSEELEKLAKMYNRPAEELRDIFTRNGNLDNLKEELTLRKTIKFLVDNSKAVSPVA
ncbi:trigger factor [Paenibacillus darwinianus]|uniref:Trigger factor n=1 Tax=Paenibacillus darwinianus TaxID=1380763 RepID=A0A9W5W7C1_9BACL|nr:trigger factor [Paenibacillus darwinianus]EXX89354.1 trigger factor [Paenibacillus darwinianus]EXX90166.1 trigger factor [Paenibacillus darwinianus]EXX91502.1 trigger factor [Paenibacillus darwinianus]